MSLWGAMLCALGLATTLCAPAQPEPLHDWILRGDYAQWEGWGEVRPSEMGDGGARVFWSPSLAQSLREGRASHPVGAAAIRELYQDDLRSLRGFSAIVKVRNDGHAADWMFFEVLSPFATVEPMVARRAEPPCVACHEDGADFVRSQWADRAPRPVR